ncbi:MAG: dicarboxylate/amino acid:cation symporter [Rikenellaceae bacterium]
MGFLKKNSLPLLILLALILGIIAGKICAASPESAAWFVSACKWVGTAFLNLLQMIIAPLVFASIVIGVAGIGSSSNLGRISGRTLGLFMLTTVVAIIVGLVLVNTLRPGVGVDILSVASTSVDLEALSASRPSIGKILMDAIPVNVVGAFSSNNILQIIVFALLFGFFTTQIEKSASERLIKFFDAVFNVMMKITQAIIRLTPIGVFGIVTEQIFNNSDLKALFTGMGMLIVTVLLGVLIQMFVVIPLILRFSGIKPFAHMKNMSVPLITAFSTASSSATLPISIDAITKKSGVSEKIASFVLPLGATINMNGTALFECASVIFLAQAYGVELSLVQQIVVVLTSLLAAVGAAGIPMAGFVMMAVILSAVGLPLDGIGIIMSVNFIMDMARTSANVWGDCAVTAIVAKSEGESLNV